MHQIEQHYTIFTVLLLLSFIKLLKWKNTGPRQLFDEEVGQMSEAIISAVLKYCHYGRQPLPDSLIPPALDPV